MYKPEEGSVQVYTPALKIVPPLITNVGEYPTSVQMLS